MSYSFIVPVYNGEQYIDKCLNSILNQGYEKYEVIIINDGSTDNSATLLNKYQKKNSSIKVYTTKNNGLSNARNFGLTKASGDYIIFVDVDDYIDNGMLSYLNEKLNQEKDVDIIKYDYVETIVTENNEIKEKQEEVKLVTGSKAFQSLVTKKVSFELACIYAFSNKYWKKGKFRFEPNKYHEDFGLIPYVIMKAQRVIITNKVLYYYVQTENSITRNKDHKKTIKKVEDIFCHFDNLYKKVNSDKLLVQDDKRLFNSYIANAVILSYKKLAREDKKRFKKQLSNRSIGDLLLGDTFLRKAKKLFYKLTI